MKKTIAIIGLGNMGSAILTALQDTDIRILGYDIRNDGPASGGNFTRLDDPREIYLDGHDLILAVKPQDVGRVVSLVQDNRTLVSIAAGVTVDAIRKANGRENPVIRVMPNTPLQYLSGMSVLYASDNVPEEDKTFYLDLFRKTGDAFYVAEEEKLHAVTALSGSGPAYVYLFASAMENAGVSLGLSRPDARRLAVNTLYGSAHLLREKKVEPEKAIHEVTSPGGTTIAGILAMKKAGLETAVTEGVLAAYHKSQELSGKK